MAVQADWVEKDLYAVLGVAQDADAKAIKRAYRKLARDLHPDTHPDDAGSAEKFKAVTAAYDVIGDEAKRAEYDEFRRAVASAGGTGGTGGGFDGGSFWSGDGGRRSRFDAGAAIGEAGEWDGFENTTWTTFGGDDLGDLLGGLFGGRAGRAGASTGPRRGADLEAVLDLGFDDAIRGVTTEVTLRDAEGARTFKVRVPSGVDDGQRIRLAGKGGLGVNGGPPGDLYAVVRVAAHPVFGRRGQNLTVDASVTWPQAVLGADIDVPTFEGPPVRVRVPAGTPDGRTLRVRGRGVRSSGGTGDLLVSVLLSVPEQLSEQQRDVVEAVARAFPAAA
ncbi:MAG: DnaJ C-terminal domain-containing protein [Acidimicrobiales bacterium]